MDTKTQIVIADDHTIIREGLKSLLGSEPGFEVIGEAENGDEAVSLVENSHPALVLMDLSMPKMNGTTAIKEIKRRFPETKILALTVHKTEAYIHEALEAGADGYILKHASYNELFEAIKVVLRGKRYLSPVVSGKVIEGYLEGKKGSKVKSPWDDLTSREREILKLVAEGYRNKDIADYLCISEKTVEKHRSNLMHKLDIHSLSELTAYAISKGIVTE